MSISFRDLPGLLLVILRNCKIYPSQFFWPQCRAAVTVARCLTLSHYRIYVTAISHQCQVKNPAGCDFRHVSGARGKLGMLVITEVDYTIAKFIVTSKTSSSFTWLIALSVCQAQWPNVLKDYYSRNQSDWDVGGTASWMTDRWQQMYSRAYITTHI